MALLTGPRIGTGKSLSASLIKLQPRFGIPIGRYSYLSISPCEIVPLVVEIGG